MAIQIEANYSKKLGLPQYSSHQFSVSLRAEVADMNQVGAESQRIYRILQDAVDRELQNPGYIPEAGASSNRSANGAGNGASSNGHHNEPARNGAQDGYAGDSGHGNHHAHESSGDAWACTQKQQSLILNIIDDNRLDKRTIESLAQERFGKGVRLLNRIEASGLIDELIETYGGRRGGQRGYNGRGNGRYAGRGS